MLHSYRFATYFKVCGQIYEPKFAK